jgi:glucose-6-phosphate 1-dehydrogenase
MASSATDKLKLEPAIIVIFGITGDLAGRYLLPALYHLVKDGLLHEKTKIIGVSRRRLDRNEFLKDIKLCVLEADQVCDEAALEAMQQKLQLLQLDPIQPDHYDALLSNLNKLEEEQGVCMNRLYYLAIPPQVYGSVVRHLGEHKLNQSCQHGRAATRLLVEKPFGYDLKSAEELIETTGKWFSESQTFRIDHYLAKETVQNILAFRHQNHVFSSIWNKNHIRQIDIAATETIDIEGRGNFYENTGALRDFAQSHLMQLLATVTMELPETYDSQSLHSAKQALLEAVIPIRPDEVTKNVKRGQYKTYRSEVDNPHSTTETFVSLNLNINNERWSGVPIRLSTGKALAEHKTDIVITFGTTDGVPANQLTFRIQPNEGIGLKLCVKKPDFEHELQEALMDFSYQATFGNHGHPNAYERVLVDAVRGDHSLFATSNEVLRSWKILQPILDEWAKNSTDLFFYPNGSSPENLGISE